MKAIETKYKDILFRSKLEARWAVFYDTLLIPWQYEPETYDLGNGVLYCPDFWLPKQKCYIEIKGDFPDKDEEEKANILSKESKSNVYIFYEDIPNPNKLCDYENESSIVYRSGGDSMDTMHWWCQCKYCGKLGIEFEGRSERIKCCEKNKSIGNDNQTYNSLIFINAWNISRSPRFWGYKQFS